MEFVLVLVVIAVLCLILGVKLSYLIFAAAALAALIIAASELLLTVFFIRLLFAKKQKAEFSRIGKSPYNRFKVAYYNLGGEEYPNVFPEEGFLSSKLYRSGRVYTVFLSRNKKFVFDKFSCATCILGFILTAATAAAAVMILTKI